MPKKIAVLYHANCPDGFGGAYAAWKKFGDKAEYVPVRYNIPPPPVKGKEIYMVDFCYNEKEFLEKLKKNNKSLTVIDHHKSAKENFHISNGGILDMNHSGAVLSWTYFNPKKPVPKFLKHIEDMDLWRFKIKGTKEVAASIDLIPKGFKEWDRFVKNFEEPALRKKFLEQGRLILKYNQILMRQIIDKAAVLVKFEGHEIYALNTVVFDSELGHMLYEMKPPMAILWYQGRDGIKVGLRSNGNVDVSKIANKFGGGGHRGAAGLRLKNGAKLPWKPIKMR